MAYSTLIDYEGVAIGAKEVNWHELSFLETSRRLSSRPGKYLYKELAVVGDTGVLYKAIDNVIVLQRNTALAAKIQKYYKEEIHEEYS